MLQGISGNANRMSSSSDNQQQNVIGSAAMRKAFNIQEGLPSIMQERPEPRWVKQMHQYMEFSHLWWELKERG